MEERSEDEGGECGEDEGWDEEVSGSQERGWCMRYFSVCSGIEAASVAWKGLGWECVGLREV